MICNIKTVVEILRNEYIILLYFCVVLPFIRLNGTISVPSSGEWHEVS
jgi:hypothetical protein